MQYQISGFSYFLIITCLGFGLRFVPSIYLFGVLRRFQHCTGHITTGSCKGRGNQYIQFVRVLYCKLPTHGKQLPAFPLEAMPGIEPRPQRWEARVLPLCHHGPFVPFKSLLYILYVNCNNNLISLNRELVHCLLYIFFFCDLYILYESR